MKELLAQGRAMDQAKLEEGMRSLMRDDRFACVVGWLDRNRELFFQKFATPAACENTGRLAHAAGAIHALHVLEGQLMHMSKPTPQGGPQRESHEE